MSEYIRSFILDGNLDLCFEQLGGMKWPVGVPQGHAANHHNVCAAPGNDLFGKGRLTNQTYCSGPDISLTPYCLCQGNLVSGIKTDFLLGNITATGTVYYIYV